MSQLEVDKIIPQSGTTLTIGDSGDTVNFADGTALSIDTNTLYIDSTNNRVGIGTTSPNRQLTVQSTVNAEFSLTAGNSSKSQIFFADTDDTNIGRIEYEHTNNATVFWTNNAERMRIDSSGNVLINTTDASTLTAGIKLRASDNAIAAVVTSNPSGYFGRLSTDGDIIKLRKDSTTVGSIGVVNSNNLYIQGDSTNSGLQCGTNTILPVQNGANASNTIDMGDGSNLWKDIYLGGGVYLGGTGSANKLDDYEEGTWTPTMNATGSGAITLTSSAGIYNKIGNLVYLWGIIDADLSGKSGTYSFGGFPFSCEDVGDHNNRYSGVTSFQRGTGASIPLLIQFSDGSTVTIYKDTAGNALTASDTTATNFAVRFAIAYRTAS